MKSQDETRHGFWFLELNICIRAVSVAAGSAWQWGGESTHSKPLLQVALVPPWAAALGMQETRKAAIVRGIRSKIDMVVTGGVSNWVRCMLRADEH